MQNAIEQIRKCLAAGQIDNCKALFDQAFQQGATPELIHLYALWHRDQGQGKTALDLLRKLLHKEKRLPHFVWNDLGALYGEHQQEKLAEQCFRQALAQAPDNLQYALHYGKSLLRQERLEEALNI